MRLNRRFRFGVKESLVVGAMFLLVVLRARASGLDDDEPQRAVRITAQVERSAAGESASATPASSREATTSASPLPVYNLPSVGKPRRRVGGGRRGGGALGPSVTALVPEHVGLTAQAQPSLYWRLEGAAQPGARFEVALLDADGVDPLVEQPLAGPLGPGLHRIDLAQLGVTLAIGLEYEWSVALVVDPEERSKDIVTTGWIRRVAEPEAARADAVSRAARGLWYDALDAAARDPAGEPALAALLDQAGLGSSRQ